MPASDEWEWVATYVGAVGPPGYVVPTGGSWVLKSDEHLVPVVPGSTPEGYEHLGREAAPASRRNRLAATGADKGPT